MLTVLLNNYGVGIHFQGHTGRNIVGVGCLEGGVRRQHHVCGTGDGEDDPVTTLGVHRKEEPLESLHRDGRTVTTSASDIDTGI